MSKLMIVLGILAAAIGVAVGVLGYISPGQMQVAGLTAEVAVIFLMGGILAVGLGGAIDAINDQRKVFRDLAETLVGAHRPVGGAPGSRGECPCRLRTAARR